jgi:transposase
MRFVPIKTKDQQTGLMLHRTRQLLVRQGTVAQLCLEVLARQYKTMTAEIAAVDKRIHAWHRSCEDSRRLEEISGIGPISPGF